MLEHVFANYLVMHHLSSNSKAKILFFSTGSLIIAFGWAFVLALVIEMPFANLIKLAFPQRKPKSEQPDQNGHAFQNSQNIRAIENVHGPESGKQNGLHDMHISNEYVNKAFSKL